MKLWLRRAIITADVGSRIQSVNLAGGDNPATGAALQFICGNDGFDCDFDVHKDLTGKPNKATVNLYNLTNDHRAALSERATKGPMRVRLEAGYAEGTSRIFEGDLSILDHDRKRADFITHLETGDGNATVATSRISKSWGPGTAVAQVIRDVAAALGVGEGNVRAATAGAILESWGPTYTQGTAAVGRTFDILQRLCQSTGLEWSIQDGTLQFLVKDKALSGTAVSVTPSTGLIDTVKIDHKGRLHCKTLMIPEVFPGRKIQLVDKSVWRVDKAHYRGHTKGNDWGIDLQCKPVKG